MRLSTMFELIIVYVDSLKQPKCQKPNLDSAQHSALCAERSALQPPTCSYNTKLVGYSSYKGFLSSRFFSSDSLLDTVFPLFRKRFYIIKIFLTQCIYINFIDTLTFNPFF